MELTDLIKILDKYNLGDYTSKRTVDKRENLVWVIKYENIDLTIKYYYNRHTVIKTTETKIGIWELIVTIVYANRLDSTEVTMPTTYCFYAKDIRNGKKCMRINFLDWETIKEANRGDEE